MDAETYSAKALGIVAKIRALDHQFGVTAQRYVDALISFKEGQGLASAVAQAADALPLSSLEAPAAVLAWVVVLRNISSTYLDS